MRFAASSGPARFGRGISAGGPRRGFPTSLLPAAAFIARPPKAGFTDRVTLSGSNILSLANDFGGPGVMTSLLAASCTLDETVLLGGYGAIRTATTSADLKVLTGGPSGSSPVHLVCLAQPVTQTGPAQGGPGTFMLAGDPGDGSTLKSLGIGNVAQSDGLWTYVGGFGNTEVRGAAQSRMKFDTNLHVFEAISTGTQIFANQDGGRLGMQTSGTTLSSGRMGFSGLYPLDLYGPPDTRIWWAGWFSRVLTASERQLLFAYLKTEFAYTPPRHFSATGDSITQGHIATASTTSFLEELKAQYAALGEIISYDNQGVSGQTTSEISTRSPSSFVQNYAPRGYRTEYLIINGSKNDDAGVVTPAQAYANLASISVAAQALGIKTAMSTAFYSTPEAMSPTLYAWVDALNVLIRANSCGADYVIDYYVDPILANPITTYWPDTIHPGDVALAAMATVIRGVLG